MAESIKVFGKHSEKQLRHTMKQGEAIARFKLQVVNIKVAPAKVAAVFAYTQERPKLYADLNKACRTSGGHWEALLEQYRDYLYHLNRAINSFPNFVGTAYRGSMDLGCADAYQVGMDITWQQFTSSSKQLRVAVRFLKKQGKGLGGALFVLEINAGKEVELCSNFPDEEEVLLGLNSHFRVAAKAETKEEKHAMVPFLKDYNISNLIHDTN